MFRTFKQTSSIITRLRAIMFAIAFFVVLGFLGSYISSVTFISGLQKVKQLNSLLSLSTQGLDVLDNSTETLSKISTSHDFSDLKFAFNESHNILTSGIRSAVKQASDEKEIVVHLSNALQSALLFEESVMTAFSHQTNIPSASEKEMIKNELVVAEQFHNDIKDHLRKAQIKTRERADLVFEEVFKDRFLPLQVAIAVALLFFIFVITFGFSITRRIVNSINNLLIEIESVAKGNLNKEAQVLHQDEIGKLTFAFNDMVKSIKESRNELTLTLGRIKELQNITSSYSEELTVNQVCEVTVNATHHAINAASGNVVLLDAAHTELELKAFTGYNQENLLNEWKKIPLKLKIPITEAIRFQRAIFFESQEELIERYPESEANLKKYNIQSTVAIPLMVGSSCLGGFTFHFSQPKVFTQEEKDFIISLANQCAQALHRSQLYDEAKESITARDEFISIASHELKTPLTPLKLQLQMLHRQIEKKDENLWSPEKVTRIIETSEKQIKRLSKLIEDLLDVSKITLGKLTLNLTAEKLGDVVKEVINHYGYQLRDSLEKVELDIEVNPEVMMDKLRIEQVLINLLTNAAKYAPGKPVKISVHNKNGKFRVVVRDQGPGIAKENQVKIFNRFERIRDRDNVGGLGLGLYISYQIIEAHQGKLWVESELGLGSAFVIEFP